MAIIQAHQLSKVYGSGETAVTALNQVSLSVEPGEFVAVMGPSGCGKSTLLHLLGGLDRPTDGMVTIDGHKLTDLADAQLTELARRPEGSYPGVELWVVSDSPDLRDYMMLVNLRDDARDDIIQGFGLGVVVGVLDGYVAIQGFAPACIVMGAVTLGTSCVVYIATVSGGAIATGYEIYRGIHGIIEFNRLTDALPGHFFDIPHEEPY